ncbi:hypothetical protein BS78_06G190500 [Paspalum vaginatum]|nr:hypothetical protein BS78_06G190500 [Paspalum vaginatum]
MARRGGASALIVVLCSVLALALQGAAEPLVPAMFVFGDSLVDVGNNNHLAGCNVVCRANYPRYGIDLPSCHSPTGRFSNGYNLADRLAQRLGFAESPPSFLSLSWNAGDATSLARRLSKQGINFASGGSGLLRTTGQHLCGEVLSMADQVGNFTSLVQMLGSIDRRAAADLLAKSLIFVSVGSNDLFEYADRVAANRSASRNDTEFLQGLVATYTAYAKDLYAAGAKKFIVVSPSLVGCCPSQRKRARDVKDVDLSGCRGLPNNLSAQLYPMIDSMLDGLSQELPGIKYSLADSIKMAGNFITNPGNVTTFDHACCGSGNFGGESVCNSTVHLCPDRSRYLFWDWFHPTDAVSEITANQLFVDNGTFVHPINVHQLVAAP